MKLKIKRLHPDAVVPKYAHPGDAGMDLYTIETVVLAPGERKSIPLGIAIELPPGYVALVWDKSGLSHKHGLKQFGGVIDSCYRGEYHVGVMNLSDKEFKFEKGDKVAQLLIQRVEEAEFEEVDALSDSPRGDKWLGSSGR